MHREYFSRMTCCSSLSFLSYMLISLPSLVGVAIYMRMHLYEIISACLTNTKRLLFGKIQKSEVIIRWTS